MKKREIFLGGYELFKGWRWPLALLLFGGALFYLMFAADLWMLLGVPAMKPYFADQYAILAASDCSQQGLDVFAQNPCDPYHRIHVYSRLWLVFSYFGIHEQHNTIFGTVIIGAFLFTVVLSVKPKKIDELIVSALLLSSPAIMLGVERGNSDLVMYTFCVLGVYLLVQDKLLLNIFAYFLLTLALFLKFYPVASFVVLVEFVKNRKTFYRISSCLALVVSIYVMVTYDDLVTILKNIPKPDDFFMTFGAIELLKLLNFEHNHLYILLPAILLAIVVGFYMADIFKKINCNMDTRVILLFLVGAANLCACFFTNINYHYRCVYLLCCLPYFFRLSDHNSNCAIKIMGYAFYVFMFSAVWAEFFIYWVGDPAVISILKISMMDAIRNIQMVKHASSWGFSFILLIFSFAMLRDSLSSKLFFNVKLGMTA